MATKTHAKPHPEFGTELIRDWEPKDAARAYVVLVHGLAEHSGRYEDFGSALSEAGFHVRSFDLIGAGGSGGDRWDIDDWSRLHDQIEEHVLWARKHGKPVVLMGFSLGGNLSLGYVLRGRLRPDLLVLSAPALSGGAKWIRVLTPIAARFAPKLRFSNPWKAGHLSRDPAVGEKYYKDPLVHTKTSTRFGAQFLDAMEECSKGLHELDVPTLVLHGGDDRLVPTACSEGLGDLEVVDRKVYEGLRHEIINEPEGATVIADIVAWINDRV